MALSKRDRKRLMKEATRNAINILAKAGNPVDGAPPLEFTLNGVLRVEVSPVEQYTGGEHYRTLVIHAEGYPAGAIRLTLNAATVDELRLNDPQPGCDAAMAIGRALGYGRRRADLDQRWEKFTREYWTKSKGYSYDIEDPTGIPF